MMNKVLFIIYYSKIANTGHHSCMFSVVYNNIQKITNISIKKPIILISILNKYLDISIYLDNRTPLTITIQSYVTIISLWLGPSTSQTLNSVGTNSPKLSLHQTFLLCGISLQRNINPSWTT